MRIIKTVKTLRKRINLLSQSPIGFVPTMGALHEGHLSLVSYAVKQCPAVVVSIYVNPTQFNDREDLKNYPRTPVEDIGMLLSVMRKDDIVFLPSDKEIYPKVDKRIFSFGNLDNVMEALHRPGHFNGVAQVVSRLFDLVEPDIAYFGKKDYQQLAVIRELVCQTNRDITIVGLPTVREQDGLAMSSRNMYLTESDREVALCLSRALRAGGEAAAFGPSAIRRAAREVLVEEPLALVDYLVLVHPHTLADVPEWYRGEALLAVAARVGTTRLIDNMACRLGS